MTFFGLSYAIVESRNGKVFLGKYHPLHLIKKQTITHKDKDTEKIDRGKRGLQWDTAQK